MSLCLTACSSRIQSYLPIGKEPLVNLEAELAGQVRIGAQPLLVQARNFTDQPLHIDYLLIWYDANGVTQTTESRHHWQQLHLAPQANQDIPLVKPTADSANYRIYLRQSTVRRL